MFYHAVNTRQMGDCDVWCHARKAVRGPNPHMRHWCLLLTATTNVTVDLRSTSYGKAQQRDARERQQLYAGVLDHWLKKYPTLPIVLVENSGDSLAWAKELAAPLANASARLELLPIAQANTCKMDEIGCPEADAVLRSLRASRLFILRQCEHVLKVTGRYAVTSDIGAALRGCKHGWDVAVQNSTWDARNHRVGTQVLGFRAALSEQLFGWSQAGRQACQECHVNAWVASHPEARVCHLPPLRVRPVREGSTGILRNSVR